jgi:type I restriction-modification system DNA methylase subunit
VDRTLGAHLAEMFATAIMAYAQDGSPSDYESVRFGARRNTKEWLNAEIRAWMSYQDALRKLRIVDPACGSGVFLVIAFDFLKAEYERVNKKLEQLRGREGALSDVEAIDSDILSNNLYGVDVNAESIEITKISLWLKTARRGKVLDSLDHNLRVDDSLIEDASFAYLEHGFSWRPAFLEVFVEGGFDVVLSNPPYVRMELIKTMKPYLERRFQVVADRADLYCYFYERGLSLLKQGGPPWIHFFF